MFQEDTNIDGEGGAQQAWGYIFRVQFYSATSAGTTCAVVRSALEVWLVVADSATHQAATF